jgi:hypothetical protein
MSEKAFREAMREFSKPIHIRRPASNVIDDSGNELYDYQSCCHCGQHFVMVKGSGKRRGFCMSCGGFTCGGPHCSRGCTPFMKRLERYEARRTRSLLADPDELI